MKHTLSSISKLPETWNSWQPEENRSVLDYPKDDVLVTKTRINGARYFTVCVVLSVKRLRTEETVKENLSQNFAPRKPRGGPRLEPQRHPGLEPRTRSREELRGEPRTRSRGEPRGEIPQGRTPRLDAFHPGVRDSIYRLFGLVRYNQESVLNLNDRVLSLISSGKKNILISITASQNPRDRMPISTPFVTHLFPPFLRFEDKVIPDDLQSAFWVKQGTIVRLFYVNSRSKRHTLLGDQQGFWLVSSNKRLDVGLSTPRSSESTYEQILAPFVSDLSTEYCYTLLFNEDGITLMYASSKYNPFLTAPQTPFLNLLVTDRPKELAENPNLFVFLFQVDGIHRYVGEAEFEARNERNKTLDFIRLFLMDGQRAFREAQKTEELKLLYSQLSQLPKRLCDLSDNCVEGVVSRFFKRAPSERTEQSISFMLNRTPPPVIFELLEFFSV